MKVYAATLAALATVASYSAIAEAAAGEELISCVAEAFDISKNCKDAVDARDDAFTAYPIPSLICADVNGYADKIKDVAVEIDKCVPDMVEKSKLCFESDGAFDEFDFGPFKPEIQAEVVCNSVANVCKTKCVTATQSAIQAESSQSASLTVSTSVGFTVGLAGLVIAIDM